MCKCDNAGNVFKGVAAWASIGKHKQEKPQVAP